jgi:hypothetical protein
MTEAIDSTYEDIQQKAKGPGVEEWKRVDKARSSSLPAYYRQLQDDPRITDLSRSERAWERYEVTRAEVERVAPEAKAKMVRSAETAARQSIPTPESEALITSSTDKLLLTQGEQSRIYRQLDRLESARGPLKRTPAQVLKGEYTRGLQIGGPQGGAICRAVYEIARDTGVDIDSIVDEHRRDSHRKALEDAQNTEMRLQLVGKSVSKPPFPHPDRLHQGGRDIGTYRGKSKAFMPDSRVALTEKFREGKKKPPWR